ncbi:MAG: hypothetical protein HFI09_02270 [Bacilli bacterium]|nr:hypothetical protein [Bacilli bacterium]
MNRTKYLQAVKNGLQFFLESYQQQKILELDERISKLIEEGKTEEEAVALCGDVETYINAIYNENHVNRQKLAPKKSFLSSSYEQLFKTIRHVIDVMSQNSSKANAKILLDILILLGLTCVIKIPFILVRDLGDSTLDFFANPMLSNIWHLVVEVFYLVVAITFFLNVFKKWFQHLKIQK